MIPVERQQYAVFACRSRQDLLIRYPGGVEHDGGYVVPGGREDLNASQWKVLLGEEADGGYRASAALSQRNALLANVFGSEGENSPYGLRVERGVILQDLLFGPPGGE